jgi:molybdopterin/thiamine biosynthesis adenylyltransferase
MSPLSRAELRRYSRPLLVPEWQEGGAQERLRAASVLVVGAGGLGGPVATQLAGAGVGSLVIADGDTVDVSNLHRQTHFEFADVGRSKAEVTTARAQAINPFVRVETAPMLTAENADALVSDVDLVIDATDNFEARYAMADACERAQKTSVWGAASGTTGMVSVFGPDPAGSETQLPQAVLGLRDVFPVPEGAESCAEAGVLGPLPSIVGAMMALEALKVLGGVGQTLWGRIWTFDALSAEVRVLKLRPRFSVVR